MDIIFISELRLDILVGVYDREKQVPQKVQLDLEIGLPGRKTGSARLDDTIDYAAVVSRIEAALAENHFGLLENLAEHVANLREMQTWDISKILPAHGDPEIIMDGGYDTTLIDATVSYVSKMLSKAHDADYLDGTMEDYIAPEVAKGWVHTFEPYRAVHAQNLKVVRDYWQDKKLPDIAS